MGRLISAAIISFLLILGIIIVNYNGINLNEPDGRKEFAVEYSKWMYNAAINVKNIVGYSLRQDWQLNETNITEELNKRYEN